MDIKVLSERIGKLLAQVGLPEEDKVIGRKFAFTYESDDLIRVTGIIYGTEIRLGDNSQHIWLITSPLPYKRVYDTTPPSISISFWGTEEELPQWRIDFFHNDHNGRFDINQSQSFKGILELL